jgi:hypothetical protein
MNPPAHPLPAERASTRTAWLVFAPPFAVLLLRFWLQTLAEQWPSAQPLQAAPVVDDAAALAHATGAVMWQAARPVVLALALASVLLLALWLAVRAWGWRRTTPWLLRLWLLACALAAAGLGLSHFNRAALQPLPEVVATVVQARPQASSERGPGGALTVLTLPGDTAPRRTLLEGADARALPPGRPLRLARARGRLWGDYVTGSDAPLAPRFDAPATGAAPPGAPPPAR